MAPRKLSSLAVQSQAPMSLPGELRPRLMSLGRRWRLVGIGEGLAVLIAATCVLFTFQILADWLFDLPWLARLGFLLCDGVVWWSAGRAFLRQPLVKKLSISQIALMVEKKWPQLGHVLITAVEMAEGKAYCMRGSPQLVNVVLEQARARTALLNFKEVVPARRLSRLFLAAIAALMMAFGLGYIGWPATMELIERLLLCNVPLPTKTIVVPISRDLTVPTGSGVELSAEAKGVIPTEGRVRVVYADGSVQELQVPPDRDKPELFKLTLPNLQQAFKYMFYLNDGHGPEFSVQPKPVATVDTITCEQTYPEYTGLPPEKRSADDLTLLAGSRLKINVTTTLPVAKAIISLKGAGASQEITATISGAGTDIQAEIPIPAKGLTGFSIHLIDSTGFGSKDETIYPIELVRDEPPVIKIAEPEDERITVTLRAKPTVIFDASDDYGLSDLELCYQITAPASPGQEIGAISPVQRIPIKLEKTPRSNHAEYTFSISAQTPPWQEGATVNYWVEAKDNNTVTGPGFSKTERRQLGIVTVEVKQAEILEHLKQTATAIDVLSNSQQNASAEIGKAASGAGTAK